MSTGADSKTLPITPEYAEGYERTFGDRKPQRGKWVWDAAAGRLVDADSYQPPERAVSAPIMVDRFYEGTKATDGTDIGSRKKHREYMRVNGLTTADDYGSEWKKRAAERERVKQGQMPSKQRREALERAMYRMNKP